MLLVERIGYAVDDTVVSFARDRFRGDRTRIVNPVAASAV
jgi:DNA-binding GntR family transcriptional regulator